MNFNNEKNIQKLVHEEDMDFTFSSKYLNMFVKSTSLSNTVTLKMCKSFPILIQYDISEDAYVHYYLAPKIQD